MTSKWNNYFLGMAKHVASISKDTTRVGCVIVGADDEVLSTGFNGIPRGVRDDATRLERPTKYLWVSHAEENAVAHAARIGTQLKGGTAYVTHFPCCRCARMLIQAGIRKLVCDNGTTSMPKDEIDVAREMFEEAGIRVDEPAPTS